MGICYQGLKIHSDSITYLRSLTNSARIDYQFNSGISKFNPLASVSLVRLEDFPNGMSVITGESLTPWD